jgi:hypothetical protein
MAINQNHQFEDLDGIKCAIVEKLVSAERVDFLRRILEYNRYTVVVVGSPPPKVAAAVAKPAAAAETAVEPGAGAKPAVEDTAATPAPPATYTVGVTDTTFNAVNAIFGRLLKTPEGHVVTLAYWQQKDKESRDEVPYFEAG